MRVLCEATTRTAHGRRLGQQHSEEGGKLASDRALYRTQALPSPRSYRMRAAGVCLGRQLARCRARRDGSA